MAGSDQIWLFLHLPKTAGRTLNNLFYKNAMSVDLAQGTSAPPSTDRVHYNDPGIYHVLDGFSHPLDQNELRATAKDIDPSLARFVLGHFSFGLHRFLAERQATYVTVLRDPVERVISHFNHMLRYEDDSLGVASGRLSLTEFARLTANDQARRLSGLDPESVRPSQLFNQAAKNMRTSFSVVGVTEAFEVTVALLMALLQWERPTFVPGNVDRRKSLRAPVADVVRSRIERFNDVDRQLHRLAQTMLDERVRAGGPDFQARLEEFRRQNREYGAAHPFPVDVNAATARELMRLPGVGTQRAQRVLAYRDSNGPFASFDHFCEVARLGEDRRVAIQDLVVP